MSAPRLLIMSFSPLRSDARILKQIALFKDRYEISTCGYGKAPEGVRDHVEIPAELKEWKYDRVAVMARSYRRAYWTNPVISYLKPRLTPGSFDVILANDIDTAGLALSLEAEHGVHLDLHEYCPRMKEELPRWRMFVGPFMRWMVGTFATKADSVSTVAGHIADEYRREFGLDPSVITNAAPFAELEPGPVGDTIRMVHSGAAQEGRFIELTLDAMEMLKSTATLDLYLTQNRGPYYESLKSRISAMSNVVLHDPVPYAELAHTLNRYDVGVYVLPPVNFNFAWSLPNKFFDFVQARLGVVIGPSPEMAALVRAEGIGTVTEDFTATSLAAAIDELTPEAVTGYKRASATAAKKLSAEEQVKGWARAVDALVGGKEAV
ncbi:glycosyltransferase family 1 protein [Arthrobacter sp. Ld5]|uniref:glycosyltransferase family 1 protein n=1 Tax=Arthrobacter sp. Ld5 TaxID=649152 RepID=UPI003EBC6B6A